MAAVAVAEELDYPQDSAMTAATTAEGFDYSRYFAMAVAITAEKSDYSQPAPSLPPTPSVSRIVHEAEQIPQHSSTP